MGIQSSILSLGSSVAKVAGFKQINAKIDQGFLEKQTALEQENLQLQQQQAQTNLALQQRRVKLGELKTNRNVNRAQLALEAANRSLMENGRIAYDVAKRGAKVGGR